MLNSHKQIKQRSHFYALYFPGKNRQAALQTAYYVLGCCCDFVTHVAYKSITCMPHFVVRVSKRLKFLIT